MSYDYGLQILKIKISYGIKVIKKLILESFGKMRYKPLLHPNPQHWFFLKLIKFHGVCICAKLYLLLS